MYIFAITCTHYRVMYLIVVYIRNHLYSLQSHVFNCLYIYSQSPVLITESCYLIILYIATPRAQFHHLLLFAPFSGIDLASPSPKPSPYGLEQTSQISCLPLKNTIPPPTSLLFVPVAMLPASLIYRYATGVRTDTTLARCHTARTQQQLRYDSCRQ